MGTSAGNTAANPAFPSAVTVTSFASLIPSFFTSISIVRDSSGWRNWSRFSSRMMARKLSCTGSTAGVDAGCGESATVSTTVGSDATDPVAGVSTEGRGRAAIGTHVSR